MPGKFGAWNEQAIAAYLPGFREAAKLLTDSAVNYTEIRPAWLTNQVEVDYETTNEIKPQIELIGIDDVPTAYQRIIDSDVHYRFVIDMATLK